MENSKEKGMSIFLDVFRRADKNDDGCLSWDEFRGFFADGVLSDEELKDLFNEIDTHNTNNIDTGELVTYFSQHLGAFKDTFGAIEDMNTSVSRALHTSAQEYSSSSKTEKFSTRFLLRELVNQMAAVQRPLEAASDHLDEQAKADCSDLNPAITLSSGGDNLPEVVPGRFGRRMRRMYGPSCSWPGELEPHAPSGGYDSEGHGLGGLPQEIERLRLLVDRLDKRVNVDGITDEEMNPGEGDMMLIVQRRLVVNTEADKAFKNQLKTYVTNTEKDNACLHIHVRVYSGSRMYIVYEIWSDETEWKHYMRSDSYKKFQHSNVDSLELPEQVKSLPVPRSWWIRE